MSSAEARQRLLAMMVAAAFIAAQMRELSNARIEDDDLAELEGAMEKLTAERATDLINNLLGSSPAIFDDATLKDFVSIFGGGQSIDGMYKPLTVEGVREALRLNNKEIQSVLGPGEVEKSDDDVPDPSSAL